jgi:predicted RNA-binding protein
MPHLIMALVESIEEVASMCESNAYFVKDGTEQLVMESVDIVEPEATDQYRLVSIFGEQKTIRGRIKSLSLVDHKILFEEKSG